MAAKITGKVYPTKKDPLTEISKELHTKDTFILSPDGRQVVSVMTITQSTLAHKFQKDKQGLMERVGQNYKITDENDPVTIRESGFLAQVKGWLGLRGEVTVSHRTSVGIESLDW